MTISKLKCPFCTEKMEYRTDSTPISLNSLLDLDTHVWICPQCPFVGFEYYNPTNITALTKLIT